MNEKQAIRYNSGNKIIQAIRYSDYNVFLTKIFLTKIFLTKIFLTKSTYCRLEGIPYYVFLLIRYFWLQGTGSTEKSSEVHILY